MSTNRGGPFPPRTLTSDELEKLYAISCSGIRACAADVQALVFLTLPSSSRGDLLQRSMVMHVHQLRYALQRHKKGLRKRPKMSPAHQYPGCEDGDLGEVRKEDGVQQFFSSYDEARQYARFSIGRTFLHRFRGKGNRIYACAESNCPARRKIKNAKGGVVVCGSGNHNHEHVAKGKKRFLTEEENIKFQTVLKIETPTKKQAMLSDLGLTTSQISSKTRYEFLRKQGSTEILEYISLVAGRRFPEGARVIDFDVDETSTVIIVSADALLEKALSEHRCVPGIISIDGNNDHLCGHTVMKVGTLDRAQHYHDLIFAIISGNEAEKEVLKVLDLTDKYIKEHFPKSKGLDMQCVMVDGAEGIRNAVAKFKPGCKMGMCYFHLMAAVKQHAEKLPGGKEDMDRILRDVNALASVPPEKFDQASSAMLDEWGKIGFAEMGTYFRDHHVKKNNGYTAGFLGLGAPRTNNGLESSWKDLHRFSNGVVSVTTMLDTLLEFVVPCSARNDGPMQSGPYKLSVEACRGAVALACSKAGCCFRQAEPSEVFYCRKSILGMRPGVTAEDVAAYEAICREEHWSYEQFRSFTTMRKYTSNGCTCDDGLQYGVCPHSLSVKILRGEVAVRASWNPAFTSPASRQPKRVARAAVKKPKQTFVCPVCQRDCQNPTSLKYHITGKVHSQQAKKLWMQHNAGTASWGKGVILQKPLETAVLGETLLVPSQEKQEMLVCVLTGVADGRAVKVQEHDGTKHTLSQTAAVFQWFPTSSFSNITMAGSVGEQAHSQVFHNSVAALSQDEGENPDEEEPRPAASDQNVSEKNLFLKEFASFLSARKPALEPVFAAFKRTYPRFNNFRQHDAQEALSVIVRAWGGLHRHA